MALCVRWYLAYALGLRNLEKMMAERSVTTNHSTRHRWGRMDKIDIKINGQWRYLYRAVDTAGQTSDFLLTAKRDPAAVLRFFRKAIRYHGEPEGVTIDKSGANTAALTTLNADKPEEETMTVRQNIFQQTSRHSIRD